LALENWKRSTWWRLVIKEIGRPTLRAHDLRHTYASLARRAVADPISTAPEDAGSCVYHGDSAHHADLHDEELDDVASALDALTSLVETTPDHPSDHVCCLAGY
jgi:integrase